MERKVFPISLAQILDSFVLFCFKERAREKVSHRDKDHVSATHSVLNESLCSPRLFSAAHTVRL
jgi:hypothetical protein